MIDTDVLVAAFLSSVGASRQLVLDALDRRFALLLSTPLMMQYESVLRRPEHLVRAGANVTEILEILDALAGICVPVVFDYTWRPTGADANDELVLETAINGHATELVTFNLKDSRRASERFGIPALRPGPLVRRLRT
ncbi:MAG: putative toxin-antitoxin system toxin component, PIN family [Burkholderiaceae bacterium]